MSGTTATIRVRRGGFTIVELLIAIGVLALVSIGLSVIFGSIGSAVSEGRRASAINSAAQRIENQIRADLERLTRDGYMVIAQRYASDEFGQVLNSRLSTRDRDGRPRRADELMFFARGDFTSMRPPLVSGVQASSNEAAVYYGIGQKRPADLTNPNDPGNYFFNPFPADSNLQATRRDRYRPLLGVRATGGRAANPNEYARDWSLLRQVTLLTSPQPAMPLPAEVYGISRAQQVQNGTRLLLDGPRQIALQPASRSLFNSMSWTNPASYIAPPGAPAADGASRAWVGDVASFPGNFGSPTIRFQPAWRASGVVDVAVGTVASIKQQIESLTATGTDTTRFVPPGSINNPYTPRPAAPGATADAFAADWLDPTFGIGQADAVNLNVRTQSRFLRAWALDSMPSLWDTRALDRPVYLAGVRYEDGPTRLVFEGTEFPNNDAGRLGRAIAEANQEMLGSQVFVPRVTEFIVEWTYGYVDPTLAIGDPDFKQMRWYGLPRSTRDANNDGVVDLADHGIDPDIERYPGTLPAQQGQPGFERVMASGLGNANLRDPDFAVFGFVDPNGTPDNQGDDVRVPWPKFIRITMSLADPEDLSTERTFQFVFQVPGERG